MRSKFFIENKLQKEKIISVVRVVGESRTIVFLAEQKFVPAEVFLQNISDEIVKGVVFVTIVCCSRPEGFIRNKASILL